MRHYGERHGRRRRIHHERSVRRRHASAGHLRLQAALHRRRAARVCVHRLPSHRCRRPRRRIECVRFDRDLRRRLAHSAAQVLRGGQAQRNAGRASSRRTCGCQSRCWAICGRSLPPATSPRQQIRELVAQVWRRANQALHAGDDRLRRAPDARRARAICPTASGASRTGSTTTASTTASRSACS